MWELWPYIPEVHNSHRAKAVLMSQDKKLAFDDIWNYHSLNWMRKQNEKLWWKWQEVSLKKRKSLKCKHFKVNTVQLLKSVLITLVLMCDICEFFLFDSNLKKINYLNFLAFSNQNLASSTEAEGKKNPGFIYSLRDKRVNMA